MERPDDGADSEATVDDYASMLMQSEGPEPDGLDAEYWLAPNLPYALKQRVEIIFEVLSHLPLEQPLAVVADAGKTVAVNAPLLRLLGGAQPSMVGQMWSRVMPAWPDRSREFRREGEQVFEEHLVGAGADSVWVRVSLGPIAERGEQRAMAYVLFISKPDVETVDHEEVRRLRKSLQLLADTQTDYVVEVDRAGIMSFVSPSFCRSVGADERELIGQPFAARVLAEDRIAVANALDEALRPPFTAAMSARLSADPQAHVDWQIDAVIGDGIVGLDLVGRRGAAASAEAAAAATAVAPAAPMDPRLAAIKARLDELHPGDEAGLVALAREVAAAAGAECVSYTVRHGDVVEQAIGWRLPPS